MKKIAILGIMIMLMAVGCIYQREESGTQKIKVVNIEKFSFYLKCYVDQQVSVQFEFQEKYSHSIDVEYDKLTLVHDVAAIEDAYIIVPINKTGNVIINGKTTCDAKWGELHIPQEIYNRQSVPQRGGCIGTGFVCAMVILGSLALLIRRK